MRVIHTRRTFTNLGHVVGGEMLLRIANVAVAILIGRLYGAAVLGIYATILAVATFAERLSDNGLELTAIAEVSGHPEAASEIAASIYFDKTLLSAVTMGSLVIAAWIAGLSRSYWLIAAVLMLRTCFYSYCRLHAGLLKALDKTRYIARIQAGHFVLLTFCVLLIYLRRESLIVLLVCLLGAQVVEYVSTCVTLYRVGLPTSFPSLSTCWRLVLRSTPVGMTYTFSTAMLRGDLVVFSLLASPGVVGTFAAANTGLVMIYVIAWLFSGVLLSDLGGLSHDPKAFDSHFRKCLQAVVLVSVPLAMVGILLAPIAITLCFGKNFSAAGLPAAVMVAALPLIFLNATFLSRVIARNASHISLAIYGFTAILSLLLNYLLGRGYGATGVACSIVIREAVMTLIFVRFWNLPDRSPESLVAVRAKPDLAELLNT
jgi:O-antigen/teichoic acid export membrane protein